MTTYSNNLRLALQAKGENDGSWGSVLNNGVFKLIEDAISNMVILPPADEDMSASTVDGGTDDARMLCIRMTGDGGGAEYTVTVPQCNKFYLLHNAMSDTDDVLTVTAGGGTDVSIAQNVFTLVYVDDGNDIFQINPTVSSDFTDDVTIVGSLTVGAPAVPDAPYDPLPDGAINAEMIFLNGQAIIPPGFVVAYAGNTPPNGWLLCDGSAISQATYAALFSAIGTSYNYTSPGVGNFRIPDLRGYFIRGLDTTVGTDPDYATRTLGSKQNDMVGPHTHPVTYQEVDESGVNFPGGSDDDDDDELEIDTDENTGTETRPKNVAMNYIIKT